MRAIHAALTPGEPRTAPPRRRGVRLPGDGVSAERVELIRFDWTVTAGVQPVILVTRRRLD